jgi:hypothetical protein
MTQSRCSGGAALERTVDAGQDTGRAHIGVLIKTLANFETQPPERDVVRNMRVASGAEQNRVLVAQRVQTVLGHHLSIGLVPVAIPTEILEIELKVVAGYDQGC